MKIFYLSSQTYMFTLEKDFENFTIIYVNQDYVMINDHQKARPFSLPDR